MFTWDLLFCLFKHIASNEMGEIFGIKQDYGFLFFFQKRTKFYLSFDWDLSGTLPTTFLGLPFGACLNSTFVWDGVEDGFRKKLAIWKKQHISKGGRVTLIKSILSNLPIYIMSLFRLPKGVMLQLEMI